MRPFLAAVLFGVLALPAPAAAQYYPPTPAPVPADPQTLVTGWYQQFLNRQPDQFAAAWINSLRNGTSPEEVLSEILGSPEYYLKGGNNPQGFIRELYLELAGREPTPQEYGHWLRQMNVRNRHDIAYSILNRFPQAWQGGVGGSYYPAQPGYPPAQYNYEYRRPYYRYRQPGFYRR